MNEVQKQAIPGVRCGKCLGRIDGFAIDFKRKLHDKLHPEQPFVYPSLCSECLWAAIVNLSSDESESGA